MSNWPITILFSIAVLLGLATEGVILYAQSQNALIQNATADVSGKRQTAEANIAQQKARIEEQAAINAALLEKAKAAKATADALLKDAEAGNAGVRPEGRGRLC